MTKGKLFGFLAGLFLGATALIGTPKSADAQSFRGINYSKNAIITITHQNGIDTACTVASTYISRKEGWSWSRAPPLSWNLQPGDSVTICANDSLKVNEQYTKRKVEGTISHLVIPTFSDKPKNYTIAIRNITSPDTLVEGKCRIKHDGKFSDWVQDTFNLVSTDYDLAFNLARSDSVQNWASGGNWNNLLNDSIFVEGKSIPTNYTGNISGKIQRSWIDGDTLPDFSISTPNAVEMSYFGAMPSKNGIKLEWETQSSLDSYLWEILRGQNNDSLNYDLIATQPGDGNSNQPKHWYYDDACAKGTNWYKLAEVDFSGAKTFYGPFSATAGLNGAFAKGKFKAFPNPTNSLNKIKVDKAGKYDVYNIAGQKAGTLEYNVNGTTTPQFSSPTTSGVYLLRQEETGETQRVQVVK